MTAHTHRVRVPGCFRCELGRDEVEAQQGRPLTEEIRTAHLDGRPDAAHWGDCHLTHPHCAIAALLAEVARLRDAAMASRSLLADLSEDYDLHNHAYTHTLLDVVTAKLDAALDDQEDRP